MVDPWCAWVDEMLGDMVALGAGKISAWCAREMLKEDVEVRFIMMRGRLATSVIFK